MKDIISPNDLIEILYKNPTPMHFASWAKEMLLESGFEDKTDSKTLSLERGGSYFIRRNSALLAFKIPNDLDSMTIIGSHSDSPVFKVKHNPEIKDETGLTRLNVECYGGELLFPWFDRPLKIAGSVYGKKDGNDKKNPYQVEMRLLDMDDRKLLIPSLAIHQHRDANDGWKIQVQKEMMPIFSSSDDKDFLDVIAKHTGFNRDDILDYELFLVPAEKGFLWGGDKFISSARIDNMESAILSIEALVASEPITTMPIAVVFDNEEIGSSTTEGALSDFLSRNVYRILRSLELTDDDIDSILNRSLFVSSDNGHATHPAYKEKSDVTNIVKLNGGVMLKYAANHSYSTSGETGAILRNFMNKNDIKYQTFHNHSDERGGATIGALTLRHMSIKVIDVGLPVLAMHSPLETQGAEDIKEMLRLFKMLLSV